jgi:hypothetical protein
MGVLDYLLYPVMIDIILIDIQVRKNKLLEEPRWKEGFQWSNPLWHNMSINGWKPNPYLCNMSIAALEIHSLNFDPPYPYSPSFDFGFQHIELIGPNKAYFHKTQ